jgi:mRNA-degrading endonuclease YafQ of YafQ-DinJ toxin-antitoxin module
MYSLEFSNQYLKDLKLARKRKFDEEKLNRLIQILISGNKIPANTRTILYQENLKDYLNAILHRIGYWSIQKTTQSNLLS